MAGAVTISEQANNSLGYCYLLKYEDDFTGELYDKMLYPASDYSAAAVERFLSEVVADDEYDVDSIQVLLDKPDAHLEFLADTYKARFGVEYRDMHTAIHHLLVVETEQEALDLDLKLGTCEEDSWNRTELEDAFAMANEDLEIDFRDFSELHDGDGGLWYFYDAGQHGILTVNHLGVYDLYL